MKNDRRDFLTKSVLLGLGISSLNGTQNAFSSTRKSTDENNFQSSQQKAQTKFYKSIISKYAENSGELVKKAIDIFKRFFADRTGIEVSNNKKKSLVIKIEVLPKSIPDESVRIRYDQDNKVSLSASDENGFLYGIGKLLHSSILNENGFSPGKWEGVPIPKKPFRAIYFATHFYNFYHVPPIDEVKRYIEKLSLWGP